MTSAQGNPAIGAPPGGILPSGPSGPVIQRRFQRLADALPQLAWVADGRGEVVYVNALEAAYVGLERRPDGTWDWQALVHPDDLLTTEAAWRAAQAGPATYEHEHRLRVADGTWRWHLSRAVPARVEGALCWFGTVSDVHALRQAEANLDPADPRVQGLMAASREVVARMDAAARAAAATAIEASEARDQEAVARARSDEEFRTLADNISQLAWSADASGWIGWYNRRWFEYTGATLEAMQGWGWQAVHHPDHVGRVTDKFKRHIASGEPWEDTFPLRGRDGVYRWFLSRALPIRDAQGHVVRWFGTNTDITAQRRAEESLKEADRRKDAFLAMLAHELRNPLAPVRTAVAVLQRTGTGGPLVERARDVIERQVAHMALLLDDLLDVSRLARGGIHLRKERCDVASLVGNAAEDYRQSLEAGGLTVEVRLPEGPLWVEGDRTRLAQAVGNLLHNAGKFGRPGGRVTVEVRSDPAGLAVVRVADTGEGIDPQLLPRLFDAFSQADQGLDRSRGGLGLGLSLVKGLIELHGGSVEAESPGPGRGATFWLRLPLLSGPHQEPAAAAGSPGEGRPLTVVLIDDNRDMVESLRDLLALSGCAVEVAFDGRSGIDRVRAARPDLVLCDIGLPGGVDGYEVARTVRSDPRTASAYLAALSGYGQEEDRGRSLEAGFDLHLVKPVDPDRLETVLEGVRTGGHGAS